MSASLAAVFALTPRVLELGMAYIGSTSIWEIARPHMERLVARTGESSSLAQLDGSDIVYVARVAVPKVITFAVTIGTRFPALQTSLGKALLASLYARRADKNARRAESLRDHAAVESSHGGARPCVERGARTRLGARGRGVSARHPLDCDASAR